MHWYETKQKSEKIYAKNIKNSKYTLTPSYQLAGLETHLRWENRASFLTTKEMNALSQIYCSD